MSDSAVAVVREMNERFMAGERESLLEMMSEDVLWDTTATRMPEAGLHRGRDAVNRFFSSWLAPWQDPQFEAVELIDAGDSVVSIFRWTALGRSSGVRTEQEFSGVYDVSDGMIIRFRGFDTREEAMAAAGLD